MAAVGSLAGAIASASYVLARNPASADKNLDPGSFCSSASPSSAAPTPLKDQEKPRNDAPRTSAVGFDSKALEPGAKARREINPSNHAKKVFKSMKKQEDTRQSEEKARKAEYEVLQAQHETERQRVMYEEQKKLVQQQAQTKAQLGRYEDELTCKQSQKSFVCPVENCGRKYKRQDHLNRHALTHKGNLFPCTWEGCDLSFNVNSNLQRHLKLHEKWGATLRGSKKAEAQLICPETGCGKVFKYPSLLQTHIDNVHDSLKMSQAVCMERGCGESFNSPSELRSHKKVAHCFTFCETCGVSMLKTSLRAHARKHEAGQVLLRCPHPGCLHSYSKNSNLNIHIQAVHMNLKPYACSHAGCEMRFAYKCVRDKHEQCSAHASPVLGGDFEAEDLECRLKSQGGRKRLRLHRVDDLLPQKWRSRLLE